MVPENHNARPNHKEYMVLYYFNTHKLYSRHLDQTGVLCIQWRIQDFNKGGGGVLIGNLFKKNGFWAEFYI